MSSELVGVIIGGAIGIIGSIGSTFLIMVLSNRKRASSIRAIVVAEVTAIKEKAQRYIDGQSTVKELSASTPMLTSIATEIGFLSPEQAVAFRRTVTLDMEMRTPDTNGTKEKASAAVEACQHALRCLSGDSHGKTI